MLLIHALQPFVSTLQIKSISNSIAIHLWHQIVHRIVCRFVRKFVRVDGPLVGSSSTSAAFPIPLEVELIDRQESDDDRNSQGRNSLEAVLSLYVCGWQQAMMHPVISDSSPCIQYDHLITIDRVGIHQM
jgi:hypothetical protein